MTSMSKEYGPSTGYESSPEITQTQAHFWLRDVANELMWGSTEHPYWCIPPSEQERLPYWEKDQRRIKYLALYRPDKQQYTAAELRMLHETETYPSNTYHTYYSLLLGDIEIVWSTTSSDVMAYEVNQESIIDGIDAPNTLRLAQWLKSSYCQTYDPAQYYVDHEGQLVMAVYGK
jgi:hypothetical protein